MDKSLKHRYYIQLSYNGKGFVGWQYQPNGLSIQESVEKVLSIILREEIKISGAGRTDAGVHARLYIAHFDSANISNDISKLIYSLNNYLDKNIAVKDIYKVSKDANARFDAKSRTYEYLISPIKDPFNNDFAYYFSKELDVEKMNDSAKMLFKYSDFTSFSKSHTVVKTNNCKIMHAEWTKRGDMLVFTIKADRFLRNMVRAIVGTLLDVGQGKLTISGFCEIIEKKDRAAAGFSVPAHGLYLLSIEY